MNTSHRISRRQALRGAAGALIALPALEHFRPRSAQSALPPGDPRVITFFFGQGLPREMFEQPAGDSSPQFEGSLAPLAPFADHLGLVQGVSHVRASGDPHDVGPLSSLTGRAPNGGQAGGPSLDQVILNELHPGGSPTRIPTLSAGAFHREGGLTRHVRSWNSSGSPAALPIERPDEVFRQLFGEANVPSETNEAAEKARRYRQSVLDAVRDEYQFVTSDASPYGLASKRRISEHLERVRELEQRVFAPSAVNCAMPEAPGELGATRAQDDERGGGGGGGVDIDVGEWQEVWRNLIDLYVLGLSCDITRFGNVIFQSGGDRVRLSGEFSHQGQLITEFDDQETSHEFYHDWRPGGNNRLVEDHVHFIMAQLAYFLERMSAPEFASPEGVSLLDDTLVVITTELSNPSTHSYRDVFHAFTGGGGRFRTGAVYQAPNGTLGPDLYNGFLRGYQVSAEMGAAGDRQTPFTDILA